MRLTRISCRRVAPERTRMRGVPAVTVQLGLPTQGWQQGLQRQQQRHHVSIITAGARQLFIGDVETASSAFQPLYAFIAEQARKWAGWFDI